MKSIKYIFILNFIFISLHVWAQEKPTPAQPVQTLDKATYLKQTQQSEIPQPASAVSVQIATAIAAEESVEGKLSFGLVELPLNNSTKIVVKLMFRNGSICDPQDKDGLMNLTANVMMEGGTKEMTSIQVKDAVYPMAASYNASVDKEVTIFTFEFPAEVADKFYPILKGLILTPRFAEEDFNRIKSNQQNYVDEVIKASSDEEYSKKALESFLFRGTNYAHMIAGTSEGVKAISLKDVINCYQQYFTKQNLTIGIAGNYTSQFLKQLNGDLQSGLSRALASISAPGRANVPAGLQVEIIAKKGAMGSAIFTGTPLACTRADEMFPALMVANSWLGEHRKSYSRLYQKIREQRSMNYGDYTYIEWYNNGGGNMLPQPGFPRSSNYFSIWIRPVQTAESLKKQYKELENIKLGHAHFALRMAIREMQNLVSNGMSEEEFEATRNFLLSYTKLYVQTPSKRLGFLMDSRFYGREDFISWVDERLRSMSVDEVNKAMNIYWNPRDLFVSIVTGEDEARELKLSLESNLPSPMSYSNELKAVLDPRILKEDSEVENFPLKTSSVTIVKSEDMFIK